MPMDRSRYPDNWEQISLARRVAAGWRCEWCGAAQGEERQSTRGRTYKIVLTVAHTDLDGGDRHDKHNLKGLRALCQPCHLRYDHTDHLEHARQTRAQRRRMSQPALEI